jgi:glycogen operon protein
LSWLDWTECDEAMLAFTKLVLNLRRTRHTLRRLEYFDGKVNPVTGLRDVTWLEGNGSLLCHEEWHDPRRCHFGALLDGMQGEPPLVLLFNRGSTGTDLTLPGTSETQWQLLFDTSAVHSSGEVIPGASTMHVEAASLVCLELASGPAAGPDYC